MPTTFIYSVIMLWQCDIRIRPDYWMGYYNTHHFTQMNMMNTIRLTYTQRQFGSNSFTQCMQSS